MKIEKQVEGQNIVLRIEGRVDTTTSPQLQSEITSAFQRGNCVVLDFAGVEYISSAGLRALLIGHKMAISKDGYMKIVHVPEVVEEVLSITGFSKMLMIED